MVMLAWPMMYCNALGFIPAFAIHDDATHQVDEGGDQGHDGVALDELGGTVHGAEEVRFPLDVAAALPGGLFVNKAGAEVRVDSHLLTGHGVQGEPGGDLGHTLGALGDDPC